MKKIGVSTLGNAKENYGQILQAYALQAFLKKSGYSPYLIDYHRRYTLQDEKGLRKVLKAFYKLGHNILRKKDGNIKNSPSIEKRDFAGFYKQFFTFSEQFYSTIAEIQQKPPVAHAYICGSDQIWNWAGRYGYDKVHFLQFGSSNIKRISYAAGMSKISDSSQAIKELNEYLSIFNDVSLREPTGVPIIKKSGYTNPKVVIDPTLLLDKEDYLEILKSCHSQTEFDNSEYILGYLINYNSPNDLGWSQIEEYLGKSTTSFKYVSSEGYIDAIDQLGGYKNNHYTVPEWLSAIANSKYVLTTSYHGMLFSIIYEKPFLFYFADNNHTYGRNRIYYILSELGLEDRIYDNNNSSFREQLESPINWDVVNGKLKKLKKHSIDFLINAIEK